MNKKNKIIAVSLLIVSLFLMVNSCKKSTTSTTPTADKSETQKTTDANDVIPFFDHWKLILGDGSNVGIANNFENKDFFYTTTDDHGDWVVFKAPNAGNTHGTSNNTRTELAQIKKWYPKTANDKLTATLKARSFA